MAVAWPEIAVTLATPERASDTKLTAATPRTVFPTGSMRPRFVKKSTSVPSGTSVPAGSVTTAVTTAIPPFAITNGGLTCRKSVEPLGAVSGAASQLASTTPATAAAVSLSLDIRSLRAPVLMAPPPVDPGREAPWACCPTAG